MALVAALGCVRELIELWTAPIRLDQALGALGMVAAFRSACSLAIGVPELRQPRIVRETNWLSGALRAAARVIVVVRPALNFDAVDVGRQLNLRLPRPGHRGLACMRRLADQHAIPLRFQTIRCDGRRLST